MSSFIHHHTFPKIRFTALCQPQSQGDLGILDLLIQQGVLQLCWLLSLAQVSPITPSEFFWLQSNIKSSIVLPRLVDFFFLYKRGDFG